MADKYTSTLLPQDNTPQENQKAILDLLAKINELSTELEVVKQTIDIPALKYWQNVFTDVVSTTSTVYTDIPGFTLSFTPVTENIKISVQCIIVTGGNYGAWSRVVINGTPVYVGRPDAGYNQDGSVSYYSGSSDANANKQSSVVGVFPCQKNSTNTIKVQWRVQLGIAYINTLGSNAGGMPYSTRVASSILVEEIR